MIVIVTGGRHYEDRQAVFRKLTRLKIEHGNILVVQGECLTGADLYAREWADENGYVCVGFHPPWKRLKLAAGPARNRVMANIVAALQQPALCVWFPGDRGTAGMKEQADRVGIELIEGELV